MSQPAVSKWLEDIEAAIGVPLFVRGRRLVATPYGEALVHHAERMLQEARTMYDVVGALHQGSSGIVRIGAMAVAAPVLLPRAVSMLNRERPGLRIVLVEDIAVGLHARFARNEIDLMVGLLGEQWAPGGTRLEPLYSDSYCVIARKRHPLARRRQLAWADAVDFPWILPPADTPLRRAIDAAFREAGRQTPQPQLESVSFTTNAVLLRNSDFLGISSRSAARFYESLGVLKALPLEVSHGVGPVAMAWRDAETLPDVLSVLDVLRRCARNIDETPGVS